MDLNNLSNEKSFEHDDIEAEEFFANLYPNTPDKRSKTDEHFQGNSLTSTPFLAMSIPESLLPSPFPCGSQSMPFGSPVAGFDFSAGYSKDWGDFLARSPPTMSPAFHNGSSKGKRERKVTVNQPPTQVLNGASSNVSNLKSALSEVISGRVKRNGKYSDTNFQNVFSEDEEKRLQHQQQTEIQHRLHIARGNRRNIKIDNNQNDVSYEEEDDDDGNFAVPSDYMTNKNAKKSKSTLPVSGNKILNKKSVTIDKLNKLNEANILLLMNTSKQTSSKHDDELNQSTDLSSIKNKGSTKTKTKKSKKQLNTSQDSKESIESSLSQSPSKTTTTTTTTTTTNHNNNYNNDSDNDDSDVVLHSNKETLVSNKKKSTKISSKKKSSSSSSLLDASVTDNSNFQSNSVINVSNNSGSPGTINSAEFAVNILLSLPTSPVISYANNNNYKNNSKNNNLSSNSNDYPMTSTSILSSSSSSSSSNINNINTAFGMEMREGHSQSHHGINNFDTTLDVLSHLIDVSMPELLSTSKEDNNNNNNNDNSSSNNNGNNNHNNSSTINESMLQPQVALQSSSELNQHQHQQVLSNTNNEINNNAVLINSRNAYMQEKIQANINNTEIDAASFLNTNGLATANCRCRKTKCLKLYCDCFKIGLFCESCDCTECYNKPNPEFEVARKEAMDATLGKNPVAFKPRVMEDTQAKNVGHVAGCRCKKSNCLKKYCECFNGNAICGPKCRCVDCKNKSEELFEQNKQQQINKSENGGIEFNANDTSTSSANHQVNISQISAAAAPVSMDASFRNTLPSFPQQQIIHDSHASNNTGTIVSTSSVLEERKNLNDNDAAAVLLSPKKSAISPIRQIGHNTNLIDISPRSSSSSSSSNLRHEAHNVLATMKERHSCGYDDRDMGNMQMRASLQSSLLSSTDESQTSLSINHLDMNDSQEWNNANRYLHSQNNKLTSSINSTSSDPLINSSLVGENSIAIASLLLQSPAGTTPGIAVIEKSSFKSNIDQGGGNNSKMFSYGTSSHSGMHVTDNDQDFNSQHLINTDSNLSFQSVASHSSTSTYLSAANFKPAILRQPTSAISSSSRKKQTTSGSVTSKTSIDSILKSISANKKKSSSDMSMSSLSSPMTKLIELAGLCEDRGHGGAEETLLSLSPAPKPIRTSNRIHNTENSGLFPQGVSESCSSGSSNNILFPNDEQTCDVSPIRISVSPEKIKILSSAPIPTDVTTIHMNKEEGSTRTPTVVENRKGSLRSNRSSTRKPTKE